MQKNLLEIILFCGGFTRPSAYYIEFFIYTMQVYDIYLLTFDFNIFDPDHMGNKIMVRTSKVKEYKLS